MEPGATVNWTFPEMDMSFPVRVLNIEQDKRISFNWDDFEVRILIIAPSILRSTLDFVNRIDYEVDLIEVKRWKDGENGGILHRCLCQRKRGYEDGYLF
jgi:hypothetical protein